MVTQDDQLLSGTIADNISFFDPEIDMGKVQDAAKAAKVHDDIVGMPMQYLSPVGDMGSTLSRGQHQRVLLARALYRDPQLLLLDEGTANLDAETEAKIVELVASLKITRIIVAHRPAARSGRHRVSRGGRQRGPRAGSVPAAGSRLIEATGTKRSDVRQPADDAHGTKPANH